MVVLSDRLTAFFGVVARRGRHTGRSTSQDAGSAITSVITEELIDVILKTGSYKGVAATIGTTCCSSSVTVARRPGDVSWRHCQGIKVL